MTDLSYRLNRLRNAVAAWRQTIAPNADPHISIQALKHAPLYLDDISAAIAAADSSPTLAQTEDADRVMDDMHDRIEWLLARAGPTTQCDYLKRFPEDADDDS